MRARSSKVQLVISCARGIERVTQEIERRLQSRAKWSDADRLRHTNDLEFRARLRRMLVEALEYIE